MSSGNELTPQQEFDSVLSKAAVDIARMEQVRDDPGRPASPAPAPKPPGTPPTGGGRPPVDKDFQNNAIADKKAETLKKIGEISNKVPADQKKEMQDKAYATLYPGDKKDLNQIPANKNARDEKGNRLGDKEIDNAQERANALKGKSADKGKGKDQDKGDKEISKSQDKMEALKSNANAQKKEASKAEKPQAKGSMSKQFTQPLQQGKNVQNPSQSKSQSMSARFTQSMNHSKSSPSPSAKSSPGKSSPGGRGSSGGGKSKG